MNHVYDFTQRISIFAAVLSACAVVWMAAAPVVTAQEGTIEGRVLEDGVEQPLPGVNVYIESLRMGAASRPDGTFQITGVPAGEYTVVASMVGFARQRQTVAVAAGETADVAFALREVLSEVPELVVERSTLTGGRRGVNEIPGSAAYVGPQELDRYNDSDMLRLLRTVPGVNVVDEEGYGLRPNIGMRGTGTERSSKITLMEDGILTAPAPYAAPAAYYVPTLARMQAAEVRKGSSQIRYGPFTTGGALNLISRRIPGERSAAAELLAGSDENRRVHAWAGTSGEELGPLRVGVLVETLQERVEGFKRLDGGGDTGFEKQDYHAKLRFRSAPGASLFQSLTLKAVQVNETSNETYLGLTREDFARTPFRRYAGSQEDVMNTEFQSFSARHVIQPASFLDVTTTAYTHEFARNWYKLDRVRATEGGPAVGISTLLDNPETFADEFAIVTGATSPNDDALQLKNNNRAYYAFGLQQTYGLQFDTDGIGGADVVEHDVEFGWRYHYDEIDRFQWVDLYRMDDGRLNRTERGTPGTESNRIQDARTFASYVQYRLTAGRLSVVPGLRYEHIDLARENFGGDDPERLGTPTLDEKTLDVWIPGIGVDYKITDTFSTFAGVHKGFAPPGPTGQSREEESVNYELGTRYHTDGVRLQAVGFFNDYSNLVGADLAAAGGGGTLDQFNGGDVEVLGLEFEGQADLGYLLELGVSVPLQLSYTYTDATFQNAFDSDFDAWGEVAVGDRVPYLPEHQGSAQLGVETGRFAINARALIVGEMRTQAGQGSIPAENRIDSFVTVDVTGEAQVTRFASVFASVRNLTDEVYVVANRPAGLRPGLPQTFRIGLRTSF